MTDEEPKNVSSRPRTRISRLAKALSKPGFRHAYMARQLKAFLADQIRALRGDLTQSQFGVRIGKPQSVVSRLEKQLDRHISIQTLIDIATKLDIAVVIRFVDFVTFLRLTNDYSDSALVPHSYRQDRIDRAARDEENRFSASPSPEVLELMSVRMGNANLLMSQLSATTGKGRLGQETAGIAAGAPANANAMGAAVSQKTIPQAAEALKDVLLPTLRLMER